MTAAVQCPVLGLAAYSGTGKTTLLTRLIPLLQDRGLRIGVIKHAHHGFDIDHPGKDSYALRAAGAAQVLVASQRRWALMVETPARTTDPPLAELLAHLHQASLDLILVEGFRHEHLAKIEITRPSLGHPLLFQLDNAIIAVASDAPLAVETSLPQLDLNAPAQIAEFIWQWINNQWRGARSE